MVNVDRSTMADFSATITILVHYPTVNCSALVVRQTHFDYEMSVLCCFSVQCPHGSPLMTGSDMSQRCENDGDCPTSHSCKVDQNVCCPTARK